MSQDDNHPPDSPSLGSTYSMNVSGVGLLGAITKFGAQEGLLVSWSWVQSPGLSHETCASQYPT